MSGHSPTTGATASSAKSPAHAARWFYRGLWSWLIRWIRVPEHPPTLPAAPGQLHLSFQPSTRLLAYWKFTYWIGVTISGLLIMFVLIGIAVAIDELWAAILPAIGLTLFVVVATLARIALHLRYDTMWYVLTDRSLRIRRGIWIIHEVTITFENVQNVRVGQGPLQRWFGIADVMVETAGGGVMPASQHGQVANMGHRGVIEGVTNAAEIRDLILSQLKKSKTAGLGDESQHATREGANHSTKPAGAIAVAPEHLAVLREIRELVAGMRD